MVKAIDPLTRYVVQPNGCWLWVGPIDRQGYGRHGAPLAHRVVYAALRGAVPPELDHLCRNHACVNPDHLDDVSHAENVRRGQAGAINGARKRALTHCKRGHEFTSENTRIDGRGQRSCRECSRLLHQSYYHRDPAAAAATAFARHQAQRARKEVP